MRLPSKHQGEIDALRYRLAALAFETKLIRVQRSLDRKYSADQPRAPAGQSDGGRWIRVGSSSNDWSIEEGAIGSDGTAIRFTYNRGDRSKGWDERHIVVAPDGTSTIFETTGAVQTVRDGKSGEVIARTRWTGDGLEEEAVAQPAFSLKPPLLLPGITPAHTRPSIRRRSFTTTYRAATPPNVRPSSASTRGTMMRLFRRRPARRRASGSGR